MFEILFYSAILAIMMGVAALLSELIQTIDETIKRKHGMKYSPLEHLFGYHEDDDDE